MMITATLILVTVIISVIAFQNREIFNRLLFDAYLIKHKKQSWRFFSHALLHSGWAHLIVNMFVLYSFGRVVEDYFSFRFAQRGWMLYLLLYVGGVLFSTLYDFWKHQNDAYYRAVGASGAVSAVVFASILIQPAGSIILFPIPVPLPSWLFGILYLLYSVYMGRRGGDNIAHNAHFWGAVFGIVFMLLVDPEVANNFINQLFG